MSVRSRSRVSVRQIKRRTAQSRAWVAIRDGFIGERGRPPRPRPRHPFRWRDEARPARRPSRVVTVRRRAADCDAMLGVQLRRAGAQELAAGDGVEVPGGLVGQEDGRPVDQGPRDGYALHLATGQLVRPVLGPVRSMPTRRSSASERSRASLDEAPARRAGSATFSRPTTSATGCRTGRRCRPCPGGIGSARRPRGRDSSWPFTQTSPAVGRSTPATRCRSVLFPHPLGPHQGGECPGCDFQGHVGECRDPDAALW